MGLLFKCFNFELRTTHYLLLLLVTFSTMSSTLEAQERIIQAENYKYYYDTTSGNSGHSYRFHDVDIEPTSDLGRGFNVGWIDQGDWLSYQIYVTSGEYQVSTRIASLFDGGEYQLFINDQQFEQQKIAASGGWQHWQTHTLSSIYLETGWHQIKMLALQGPYNINWIMLSPREKSNIIQIPFQATASSTIQAPELAHDNNPDTRWESQHGIESVWFLIDLKQSHYVQRIEIDWEAANPENYYIEASNDQENWQKLAVQTHGQFGHRSDVIELNTTVPYRYLRINKVSRSHGNYWGYSIWEIRIFGEKNHDISIGVREKDEDAIEFFIAQHMAATVQFSINDGPEQEALMSPKENEMRYILNYLSANDSIRYRINYWDKLCQCDRYTPWQLHQVSPYIKELAQLEELQEQWQKHQFTDYQINFQKNCNCPEKETEEVYLNVVNKNIVMATTVAHRPQEQSLWESYSSVERLFNIIKEAYKKKAFSVDVEFDSTYSYPTTVTIDYNKETTNDDVTYRFHSLKANQHLLTLKKQKELWENNVIKDYTFVIQHICFCPQEIQRPRIVKVSDNTIVQITDQNTGKDVNQTQWQWYSTIAGMFEQIESNIYKGVFELVVDYDPTFAFPEAMFSDQFWLMADEEQGYVISHFQVMQQ